MAAINGCQLWLEYNRNHTILKTKEVPVKYYAHKKAQMTMIIFSKSLRAVDSSMGM
jgi:hypothetical protein